MNSIARSDRLEACHYVLQELLSQGPVDLGESVEINQGITFNLTPRQSVLVRWLFFYAEHLEKEVECLEEDFTALNEANRVIDRTIGYLNFY
jgi:hypothetical protein